MEQAELVAGDAFERARIVAELIDALTQFSQLATQARVVLLCALQLSAQGAVARQPLSFQDP